MSKFLILTGEAAQEVAKATLTTDQWIIIGGLIGAAVLAVTALFLKYRKKGRR